MAQVTDFVQQELTLVAAALTVPGFGKPLILAYDCPGGFVGLYAEYTDPSQLLTAGFKASGATYKMAVKMCSQSPRPPIFAVGKGTSGGPIQIFTLAPVGTIAIGQVFTVELDGIEYSFTATVATIENVVDGLVTALTSAAWQLSTDYAVGTLVVNDTGKLYQAIAIVGAGESATSGGPTGTGQNIADFQTAGVSGVYWRYVAQYMTPVDPADSETHLTLTSDEAVTGEFHVLSVTPQQTTTLTISQTHADPGVGTDLAAILAINPTWYAFCTAFNSALLVEAAATWALANNKLYAAQTQDSAVINVAPLTGSDVAVTLLAAGSANANGGAVALIYKSTTDDFADAAWLGAVLPLIPGSETWAFKSLVGVPAESGSYFLSETQRSNACGSLSSPGGKYVNLYENVGGANITEKGTVSSSQYIWIDLVRGLAWLQVNLSYAVFGGIIAGDKLPFTDAGIAVVQADMLGVLKQGVTNGLLTNNPAPAVNVPLASSVSSNDKQNRLLEGVTYDVETAGAIQGVSIQGSVSF